jgi:hypothetical protein
MHPFFDPAAAASDMDPQWVADSWAKCPNTSCPTATSAPGRCG